MRELFTDAGEIDPTRSWSAVRERIDRPGRFRPSRKVLVVGALATLAAAGTTAAVVTSAPIADPSSTECRSHTSDGRSITGVWVGVAVEVGAGPAPDAGPVDLCAQAWRDGLLMVDKEGGPPAGLPRWPGGPSAVPPLVLCADPAGEIAVVVVGAGPTACASAGLAVPE